MNRNTLILAIILIGIFLIFGLGKTASVFGLPSGISTSHSLMGETSEYYEYKLSFSGNPYDGCGSVSSNDIPFSFSISHDDTQQGSGFPIPNDIQLNTEFETTEVVLSGLTAVSRPCSDLTKNEPYTIRDLKAICQMKAGYLSPIGNVPTRIECKYSGIAKSTNDASIHIKGLSGGSAEVEIYKIGFAPPQPQTEETSTNEPQGEVTTDPAGNPIPTQSPLTSVDELSFLDKLNLWIQGIIDSIIGLFK